MAIPESDSISSVPLTQTKTENKRTRLSQRYLARLENYLEWAKTRTPLTFSGLPQTNKLRVGPFDKHGPTAAECLFAFETHGRPEEACCEPELLARYRLGKANRDFWTKEIGFWNRECLYCAEEFLDMLSPETFCELFGRYPSTHLVRYWFDNTYTDSQFDADAHRHFRYRIEKEQGGNRIKG